MRGTSSEVSPPRVEYVCCNVTSLATALGLPVL
jgi:hypothetical protein